MTQDWNAWNAAIKCPLNAQRNYTIGYNVGSILKYLNFTYFLYHTILLRQKLQRQP